MSGLQKITYIRCWARDLTQSTRTWLKVYYSCYYCCTVIVTAIIHPTHLIGEGDCKTQKDNTWEKKVLKTEELKVESFTDLAPKVHRCKAPCLSSSKQEGVKSRLHHHPPVWNRSHGCRWCCFPFLPHTRLWAPPQACYVYNHGAWSSGHAVNICWMQTLTTWSL